MDLWNTPYAFPITVDEHLANLHADPRKGTPEGVWHIYKPDADGYSYCGRYNDFRGFGFTYRWPDDVDIRYLEFYCSECLKHRPSYQPTLFGD